MDNSSSNNITLQETIKLYKVYSRRKNRRAATLRWHSECLGAFAKSVGEKKRLADISKMDIELYVDGLLDRHISPHSVNTYLRSIRAFFNWAGREGYHPSPPKVEGLDTDPRTIKYIISQDEFYSLLSAANTEESPELRMRAKAALLLLFTTGMRASELCGARWSAVDVYVNGGKVYHLLTIQGAKRTGDREVLLTDETWTALQDYRRQVPEGDLIFRSRWGKTCLTVNALRQLCYRLGAKAEVKIHPHLFRHAFATHALNAGMSEKVLQKICGWSTPEMVDRYAKPQRALIIDASQIYNPLAHKEKVALYYPH